MIILEYPIIIFVILIMKVQISFIYNFNLILLFDLCNHWSQFNELTNLILIFDSLPIILINNFNFSLIIILKVI